LKKQALSKEIKFSGFLMLEKLLDNSDPVLVSSSFSMKRWLFIIAYGRCPHQFRRSFDYSIKVEAAAGEVAQTLNFIDEIDLVSVSDLISCALIRVAKYICGLLIFAKWQKSLV